MKFSPTADPPSSAMAGQRLAAAEGVSRDSAGSHWEAQTPDPNAEWPCCVVHCGVCASRSSNYRISTSWTSWISTSKGIRHTGTKLRRLQTHDHRRQDHALIAISQNKFARRFGG